MNHEILKLDNQLCFPVYALSRLIIRAYQPLLDKLSITYPQYLVMLVLWEKDEISVNEISKRLILNTNTTTPLLKRMEVQGLITRTRSAADDRKVIIKLTEKGKQMQVEAVKIPEELIAQFPTENTSMEELMQFKQLLHKYIMYLNVSTDTNLPE